MLKIKDNSRILFIGDSITDIKFNRRMNRKIHGRDIYALQVSRMLKKRYGNLKFFYRGIASDRTYHVYDRLTKDCIDLKPDIIIMLIGVNDAWEHYVPEQYPPLLRPMRPHLSEIYRRINCELDNVQLMVLLPFMINSVEEKRPFHKILDEYRLEIAQMAEQAGASVVDLQAAFDKAELENEPKALAVDAIHPTNLGHRVIADEIIKNIG